VLGHDHDAARARARLVRLLVPAVEEVVETRDVGRVARRAGVARLLEVEDARRLKSVEELYSRYL